MKTRNSIRACPYEIASGLDSPKVGVTILMHINVFIAAHQYPYPHRITTSERGK
jgi:hypothetical protein